MARSRISSAYDGFLKKEYARINDLSVDDLPYTPAIQVVRDRLRAEYPSDFRLVSDYDLERVIHQALVRLRKQRVLVAKFRDRKGAKELRDAIR